MLENLPPLPHKQIGVAVIRNQQGEILIDRRLAKGEMGGLWEFPGGKIERGETPQQCIQREILEELAIEVEVATHLITINHKYEKFQVTLFVYNCYYLKGEPQPIECEEIRWVRVSQLNNFNFPEANIEIIKAIQG